MKFGMNVDFTIIKMIERGIERDREKRDAQFWTQSLRQRKA